MLSSKSTNLDNKGLYAVYSLEGELIHEFETKGSDPGKFHSPYGICIGDNGLVYVAGMMNRLVQVF